MKGKKYPLITLIFLLSLYTVSASNLDIRSMRLIGIVPANEPTLIEVYVVNTGTDSAAAKVEVGFYPRPTINSWLQGRGTLPLSLGVFPAENCNPSETNVQTKSVSIQPGTGENILFKVIAKYDPSIGPQGYGIFAESFTNCANTGLDIGIQSKAAFPVTVTDATPPPPPQSSCTDGIKNGAETDVDCGGTTCPKCKIGNTCIGNNDCASTNCLQQNGKSTCTETPPNPPPPSPPNCPIAAHPCMNGEKPTNPVKGECYYGCFPISDPLPICGNGRAEINEDCVTCPQEFGDKCGVQKPFDINEFIDKYLGGIIIAIAIIMILMMRRK